MNISAESKIFVAGHKGMVGSSICRLLNQEGYSNILTEEKSSLDLLNQKQVNSFFQDNKIDVVFFCSAKVGGIHANSTYPYDFIYQNLMMQNNVINAAHSNNVNNLLFLGSSCIYPKNANQPITENQLLTGVLEQTNQWYAIAKIAGIKLYESLNIQHDRDYRSIMPTNLYGPNDNFHELNGHVIPALIRRFYEAKTSNFNSINIWGTGNAMREFLHVDDLAKASLHIMNMSKLDFNTFNNIIDESHINVGTGEDISIKNLVYILKEISQFDGDIVFDITKPDGTPRKVLDISKIESLGWSPTMTLKNGIHQTYNWYVSNLDTAKKV